MYEEFYKLAMLPFENTPDPRFYYASEQHREALAAIEYTVRMRKGFALITGNVGTGKTTVGQVMRQRCHEEASIIEVMYGHEARDGLLRQILRAINSPADPQADHAQLVEALHTYLIEQMAGDRPVVLFVDEAQTLSDDALEELRLMSNLDTTTTKSIQIVLVGQPELRHRLRQPRHAALRQRIVMAKQIEPLGRQDTATYIQHRLAAASLDPNAPATVFTVDGIDAIYHYAGGIPRLINIACDNCMLMGFVAEKTQIDLAIVHKVIADMLPNFETTLGVGPVTEHEPAMAMAGGV